MPLNDSSALTALATPDRIANEALFQVKNRLHFPMLGTFSLERLLVKGEGARITVKRPFRAKAYEGRQASNEEISALIDEVATLVVNKRYHVLMGYTDDDQRLHIKDFSERYLMEGCKELAYYYDIVSGKELVYNTAQMSGTPNSAASATTFSRLRARCVRVGIEPDQCSLVLPPEEVTKLGDDLISQGVNNPPLMNQQVREKFAGKISQFMVYESIHVPEYDILGQRATATQVQVDGANQRGATINLETAGNVTAGTKVFNKGTVITLAGVNEVMPRGERAPTGVLKQFTILEDVVMGASNKIPNVKIFPEINDGSSTTTAGDGSSVSKAAYQTVEGTAANNALVSTVGSSQGGSNVTLFQGIAFQKQGLFIANVGLQKLAGFSEFMQSTDPETGVSISISADADIKGMDELRRCDILFGVLNPYPEVCMRVVMDSTSDFGH